MCGISPWQLALLLGSAFAPQHQLRPRPLPPNRAWSSGLIGGLLPWQRVPQTPPRSLLPSSSPCPSQCRWGRCLMDRCQRDSWIRSPFPCCFCQDVVGSIGAECISWILLNILLPCTTQIAAVILCSGKLFNASEPAVPPDLFSSVLVPPDVLSHTHHFCRTTIFEKEINYILTVLQITGAAP